jgi:hypothetical protein
MQRAILLVTGSLLVAAWSPGAHAQVIGSLDNFDVFNDSGETAEGFEIEVEDIAASDLTREFPSNFSATPWVIRYGLPTVTEYDNRPAGGHKGVRVTWAATWNGTKWVAAYGDQPFGAGTVAGHGTPYVKNPTLTTGDSCWFYGLGAKYPTSGCDHFGLSFALGATPGKVTYHWKVADKVNIGQLINAATPVALPPSPVLAYVPPAVVGAPPVVHAVAAPPEPAEPVEAQWGPAFLVKTYTSFAKVPADLDLLQKNKIPLVNKKAQKVRISWALLQTAPPGEVGEKAEVDDDAIDKGNVAVTRRYEYFRFTGKFDPATHEAICGPEGPYSNGPCSTPQTYFETDPVTGIKTRYVEKGKFVGAHMNAFNVPAL